jgi:lipopolysaccharide biosynthesis glycosyltransferase
LISEEKPCPIVLACDDTYAMPLATALRSIVEANKGNLLLEFHVLFDRFSKEMQSKVWDSLPNGSASIKWVPVDLSKFSEFSTKVHISKMTYARFLIPHVFPEDIAKVLYFDADILVLGDLGELWETDLEGAVLGAVEDNMNPHLKCGYKEHAEVPRVRDYFNAGILMIDLKKWREERISDKCLDYLTRFPRSPFSDQDALNYACDGLWKKLDRGWNFQDHLQQKITNIDPNERPKIVHFIKSQKPWKASSLSTNASFYDSFRSRTNFARNWWEKLWDNHLTLWYRFKWSLRRNEIVRSIWSRIKVHWQFLAKTLKTRNL